MNDRERREVVRWSTGDARPLENTNLAALVARRVAATPEATALVFGDRTVSYAEFGSRVATLARTLVAFGVGPDVAVAVRIPRSVELLVAIHAVVAAGGRYVPIDIEAPAERAASMIDTARAHLMLIPTGSAIALTPGATYAVLPVDASTPVDGSAALDDDRLAATHPDDAAYTLFTSGSTGRPKGVTVSHRAIVNRLAWMQERFAISADDAVLQKTPVTFDVSCGNCSGRWCPDRGWSSSHPTGTATPATSRR